MWWGATKDLFAANQKLPNALWGEPFCVLSVCCCPQMICTLNRPWFYRKSLASSGMWAVQNICAEIYHFCLWVATSSWPITIWEMRQLWMHQNNADNDNDMSMLPCHLAVLSTTEQLTMIDRAVVNCLNPYMVYQLVMILWYWLIWLTDHFQWYLHILLNKWYMFNLKISV